MESIRIVEFEPALAETVAAMWVESRDSWGGHAMAQSAADVRQMEEQSSHLNLYIAMDGPKAVGYCKLSVYHEDEGALYIDLLNVHPAYHGRKIGKALVLRSVERTRELGWPRLDLYTWSGNTKAVPLYKKCGFFWEDRDDCTHLMNFMPAVLENDLLNDYLTGLDWYQDSKRSLDVRPDGRVENRFHYFGYRWEREGTQVAAEFSRRGRGLRRVVTPDYSLTLTAEVLDAVLGSEYRAWVDVENRSGAPLMVRLQGRAHKNVECHLGEEALVSGTRRFEGRFRVTDLQREQSVWKTHPRVEVEVAVNDRAGVLGVGVVPKFPARTRVEIPRADGLAGRRGTFFLNVKNNYGEPAAFRFAFPQTPGITISEPESSVSLEAGERTAVPVPFELSKAVVYTPELSVSATRESGGEVSYRRRLSGLFRADTGFAYGTTEEDHVVANGRVSARVNRGTFPNEVSLHVGRRDSGVFLFPPKLGKPYTDEWSSRPADRAEFAVDGAGVVVRTAFRRWESRDQWVWRCIRIFANGLAEVWFEARNQEAAPFTCWVRDGVYLELQRPVLPYDRRIVACRDGEEADLAFWDLEKLSENWLFSRGSELSLGVIWPAESSLTFAGWHVSFEHCIADVPPGGAKCTEPVRYYLGTFSDWDEIRSRALGWRAQPAEPLRADRLTVNDGNPLVTDVIRAAHVDLRRMPRERAGTVSSQGGSVDSTDLATEGQRLVSGTIPVAWKRPSDVLHLQGRIGKMQVATASLILRAGAGTVRLTVAEKEGLRSYRAANELISIESSPDFAPGIYSLRHGDDEWLSSAFPAAKPLEWWNPWIGGIHPALSRMQMSSVMKERRGAGFVQAMDNRGNRWSGIRASLHVEEHEQYGGITIHQYALLPSQAPVVFLWCTVDQGMGEFVNGKRLALKAFFDPALSAGGSSVCVQPRDGGQLRYAAGGEEWGMRAEGPVWIEHPARRARLYFVAGGAPMEVRAGASSETVSGEVRYRLMGADGETFRFGPVFVYITDMSVPPDAFSDLRRLRLEPESVEEVEQQG